MFVTRGVYKTAVRRARKAEARCIQLEIALEKERDRNKKREDDLVDRILTKNNARPITPEPPSQPIERPLSKTEIERMRDIMQEEFEHRRLVPETVTPDVRRQLDSILEETLRDSRPFMFNK